MSSIVKILMQDALGYGIVMLEPGAWEHDWEPIRSMGGPSRGGLSAAGWPLEIDPVSGRTKNACTMDGDHDRCFLAMDRGDGKLEEFGPDIYMEHWSAGYEQIDSLMFFKEQTVVPLGPVGYFGTVGLYETSVSNHLAAGCNAHWTRYNSVSGLTSFNDTNSTWDYQTASPYSCDSVDGDYQYSWCKAGRYISPQCENNPQCVDVVMNRPSWEKSMFEQLVTNLNLDLNLVYLGPQNWVGEMLRAVKSGRRQLFYDFFPSVTTAQLDISRVSLPEHVPNQHATDRSNPDAANRWNPQGSVATDFPDNILTKIASARLRNDAPDAFQLVGAVQMKRAYIVDLLKKLDISGNTDTDYYDAACNWLQNNTELWNSWIPMPICAAEHVYDVATNQCRWSPEATTADATLAIAVSVSLGVALLLGAIAFYVYWRWKNARSRQHKNTITNHKTTISEMQAELQQFRDSLVGLVVVNTRYVPQIDPLDSVEGPSVIAEGRSCTVEMEDGLPAHATVAAWYWNEGPAQGTVPQWVRYEASAEQTLENSYQCYLASCKTKHLVSLSLPHAEYEIDLSDMSQMRMSTGFKRKVIRKPTTHLSSVGATAPSMGADIPVDLSQETHALLLEGTLIQISKRRTDGWAYGSVLHCPSEAFKAGGSDDRVSTQVGWFPEEVAGPPTQEDLQKLSDRMGGGDSASILAAPPNWSLMKNTALSELVPIPPGEEYQTVQDAFLASLGGTATVVGVDRVQNTSMWQSYAVKRQTMLMRDPANPVDQLERKFLFHGTTAATLPKIVDQGFNRSFCGKNATAYGKGVYFARHSHYSSNPKYSTPDANGVQHMFACRVMVGEFCLGRPNMVTPDVRKGNTLFDSTVDRLENPTIYVTYHDAQAYPDYLIHFKLA